VSVKFHKAVKIVREKSFHTTLQAGIVCVHVCGHNFQLMNPSLNQVVILHLTGVGAGDGAGLGFGAWIACYRSEGASAALWLEASLAAHVSEVVKADWFRFLRSTAYSYREYHFLLEAWCERNFHGRFSRPCEISRSLFCVVNIKVSI
jgi:hypothetical protein